MDVYDLFTRFVPSQGQLWLLNKPITRVKLKAENRKKGSSNIATLGMGKRDSMSPQVCVQGPKVRLKFKETKNKHI